MNRESAEPAEILLVEDDASDARLVREAFEGAYPEHEVHAVRDGERALDFLSGRESDAAAHTDLVLLDLTLPDRDGTAVLEEIKGDPDLRHIPVIVLTGSEARADVVESYDLHANAYLVKPETRDEVAEIVEGIADFWLRLVRLPRTD